MAAEARGGNAAVVFARGPAVGVRWAGRERRGALGPGGSGGFDEYVSDPANPVPYRPRPVPPTYPGPAWRVWLVEDQRFVDHRPDVLTWETAPLKEDVRVAGDIVTELVASTSGT